MDFIHSAGEKAPQPCVCALQAGLLRVVLGPSSAIQTDCVESVLADITTSGLPFKMILAAVPLKESSVFEHEHKTAQMKGKEAVNRHYTLLHMNL